MDNFPRKPGEVIFFQGVARSARSKTGMEKLIGKLCGPSEFERREVILEEMTPD